MKPIASIIALALALTPAYALASPTDQDAKAGPAKTEEHAHSAKKEHGKRQHAKATPKGRSHAQSPAVVPVSNRTPKATTKESKPAHKKTDKADKKADAKHPTREPALEHDHVEPSETPAFTDNRHEGKHEAGKHDGKADAPAASLESKKDDGEAKEHGKKPATHKVRLDEKKPKGKPGKAGKPTKASRTDGVKDEPKESPKDAPAPKDHKSKDAKDAKKPQKRPPCLRDVVEIVRGTEVERFPLATCDGGVAPLAVEHLSIMMRPGSQPRPEGSLEKLAKEREGHDELAPHVRKIDPRLVQRLAQVAEHFGKDKVVRVAVVSGYRPASAGSQHSHARALDFRVEGVDNTKLVELCKTFVDTGCGYYPNSSFVHMDVRDPGTGHVSWIDASGPGETPRYVASWPPPAAQAAPAAPVPAPALAEAKKDEPKGEPAESTQ